VRAIAVHLRDMVTLRERQPGIFAAFCKGQFAFSRTGRPFSRMPLDESHEQNNKCVKGDGGAIGLTESPSALLRWIVAGSEMARVVGEFLSLFEEKEMESQSCHHENQAGWSKNCFFSMISFSLIFLEIQLQT